MLLQMCSHLFLLLLLINLLADLPFSSSADDPSFTACSRDFECGGLRIGYPFYGKGRPDYCGLPDYELRCEDESVRIRIQSEDFNVLYFSEQNPTLRIASTDDIWNGNCPTEFVNISIPSNLFTYSESVTQNITLFYGCPVIQELMITANRFSCSNDMASVNYFWIDPIRPPPQEISRCNTTIVVPSMDTVAQSFRNSQSTVEEVWREGFLVEYYFTEDDSFCNNCRGSGGYCERNFNTSQSTCYCYDGQYPGRCPNVRPPAAVTRSKDNIGRKIRIGVGTGIGSIVVIVTLLYWWKRRHISTHFIMLSSKNKKAQMVVEDFLKNYGSLAPKRYNYHDIKKITDSFKNKIGQGGYGVVYKGKLDDGHFVAVKLLEKAKADGEEFMNEVASISRTSHVNVVSLLGFCFEGSKRALIYEFMANGSLEKFIYDQNDQLQAQFYLEWKTLYQITIGVARGLEYLHRGCNTRILHFDIKPHNILLDQEFTPKISDFGLAKLCPRNESIISMLGLRGTAGYIAPEVFSRTFGGVSHKSDVYSYGMMVLEIVGRRKNIDVRVDHTSEIYFPDWIYQRLELDENLGLHGVTSEKDEEITRKMIVVALWCIQTNPVDRPAITKVVEMLEGRLELLSTPPKPYLGSPARDPVGSSSTR